MTAIAAIDSAGAAAVRELADARRRTMRRSRMLAEYGGVPGRSFTGDDRRDRE